MIIHCKSQKRIGAGDDLIRLKKIYHCILIFAVDFYVASTQVRNST